MSVFHCSSCRQKGRGRMATAYWAWFDSLNERVAYKTRHCSDCAPQDFRLLSAQARNDAEPRDNNICPACGSDPQDNLRQLYVTAYLPKHDPIEMALETDEPCFLKVISKVMERGEQLPNRQLDDVGRAPLEDAWSAIAV